MVCRSWPMCLGSIPNQVSQCLMGRWSFLRRINGDRCWIGTAVPSLLTFRCSSVMVFPRQQISSASFATTPSPGRSPNTRHRSSSSAVSEPGIPIAQRAYTRTPRNTSWNCATAESGRKRWIDRWILCISTARFYVGCCLRQAREWAVACFNDQHM